MTGARLKPIVVGLSIAILLWAAATAAVLTWWQLLEEAPALAVSSPAGLVADGADKQAFVKSLPPFTGQVQQETICECLLALPVSSHRQRADLVSRLRQLGVYEYVGRQTAGETPLDLPVSLAAPSIFYNRGTGEWYVLCGGSWQDIAWLKGLPKGDLKGPDLFGVTCSDTKNYDAYVTAARAVLQTADGLQTIETHYRADGDGEQGFMFSLQDRVTDAGLLGHHWAGFCVYSPEWTTCSTMLTAFYRHD